MFDVENVEQINIMENAKEALNFIDDEIVGYDDQEKQIEDLVVDFLSTKKGQCCLLEGYPNCGRQSLVTKVLKKYKLCLRTINVGFVAADPLYQESLAREDDEGFSIFLIRDSDELLTSHQQEFLYTMVDKATTFSWLVFFSLNRHNFSQNLEKRGNSRMPRIRITFEPILNFDEYCNDFQKLLLPNQTSIDYTVYYKQFVEDLNVKKWLRPVFDRFNYDVLKKIAAQILMRVGYYCEKEDFVAWNKKEIDEIVEEVIETIIPSQNRKIQLLSDQTLRTKCVFLCIHRLLKNRNSDGPLLTPKTTYRTVFLEYKQLVNNFYKLLDVSKDIYIFREIDHLVEIGLVVTDKNLNITNTSFRKVWLNFDPALIQDSIGVLKLPTTVKEFFGTVLK